MSEQIEQDPILAELESFRDSDGDIEEDLLGEGWECVEDGGWTQEYNSQLYDMVVKHIDSCRHFRVMRVCSGSYNSDWYFSPAELSEVKPVTEVITVTKWVAI